MTKELTLYDFPEQGDETAIPTRWCICGACSGHGKSSAYLGAFDADRWGELDDEWKEDYIAGAFDRACDGCGGSGKVLEPNTSAMKPDMRAAWEAKAQAEAADRRAERQEYLFCGGWREEGW